MDHKLIDMPIAGNFEYIDENPVEDYSNILNTHRTPFKRKGFHLCIGEPKKVQGWILHISVVRSQIARMLDSTLLILVSANVPFKIVCDKETARSVLDGGMGQHQIGKIISIYPETDDLAVSLAKDLISLTDNFIGPAVPTDIHLGASVYTRFGGFNPVIMKDGRGIPLNFIYNQNGQLVHDTYEIPYIPPPSISWPFGSIRVPQAPKPSKLLKHIYKPIKTIKQDPRGNVYKALYLKNYIIVNRCIIKQAVKHMWSDECARDMHHRLVWQQKIHGQLDTSVPLPKIIDFFIDRNDAYLAMEYIKGISLLETLNLSNSDGVSWGAINNKKRINILDYLIQIINIVATLHAKGFVHRDITPVNFLVDRKGKLTLIDNELAYSINEEHPTPPFEAGTHGFMSPEQIKAKVPTCKEDIYGLCSTILTTLIGLSPITFQTGFRNEEFKNLRFFIGDDEIANMISTGHSSDPNARPSITCIRQSIVNLKSKLSQEKEKETSTLQANEIDRSYLKAFINKAINGLVQSPTVIFGDLWLSRATIGSNPNGHQNSDFVKSTGLYEGIAGPLYMLARGNSHGFNIEECIQAYRKGWTYLHQTCIDEPASFSPGLHGGSAGIALALNAGLNAKLINENDADRETFHRLLEPIYNNLDFSSGAAGIGVAILQCMPYLERNRAESTLKEITTKIIGFQQKDGTWTRMQIAGKKPEPTYSFSYGDSGIIWYLLEYFEKYGDRSALVQALHSMKTMSKILARLQKYLNKYGYIRSINGDPAIFDSMQGITQVLLKAYQATKDSQYKLSAESILMGYPRYLSHENFDQATGISGLGELYLDAGRILNNDEFSHRAHWLVNFFLHTYINHNNNCYYWNGLNKAIFPTADLMVGNSGIIHFLMRYYTNGKLGHILLN
jgi:serine/threonine protein kinase